MEENRRSNVDIKDCPWRDGEKKQENHLLNNYLNSDERQH